MCAHDLRGALTVIAGYAELLRRDDLSAVDRATAVQGIGAAVERADRLLGDTLSGRGHVRTEQGLAPLVDLAAAVERACEDARVASGREITLEVAGSPRAHADLDLVARILENLLGNAAKYAPDGPIDVRLAETAASDGSPVALIEVADRGPGIPEAERDAVWNPFARLERDEGLAPGTGLGLTVVRSAAERMGGRASVRAREGGGAVFAVELPAG